MSFRWQYAQSDTLLVRHRLGLPGSVMELFQLSGDIICMNMTTSVDNHHIHVLPDDTLIYGRLVG